MQEFADFLGKQAPYDALDAEDLERLARRVEVEYFPQGAAIITPDTPRLDRIGVVRTGVVEMLDRGRVVDELGPGDTFGQLSVLSGLPPGLTVRAAVDTLVYLLPDPRPILAHPERLAFRRSPAVGRTLLSGGADYGLRPVTDFMRDPLWCSPQTPIREAAALMTEARTSFVLIQLGDQVGIMTDSDCRRRVATGEVPVDAQVSAIASVPVRTIDRSEAAAVAFLQMVQYGVHHLVVIDDDGRPVGVCRVVDLSSADIRDPLAVRATIDAADSLEELAGAAAAIRPAAVELFDAGIPVPRIGGLLSALVEAVLERCIAWTEPFGSDTEGRFAWLVLGSLARREPLPDSDVDTALVWRAPAYLDRPEVLRVAADEVLTKIERCGLSRCPDGANADVALFNRPFDVWVQRAKHWEDNADGPGSLLLSAMLADSRPVTGLRLGRKLARKVRSTPENPFFRKRMLQEALAVKAPVGFVKQLVVEHDGAHKGELDLKRRGLKPIAGIGRWIGICTASPIASTPDRLTLGAEAGLLTADEAQQLRHAHEEMYELLFRAEVTAIRSGHPVSTYVDPTDLDTLTRRQLRESFKAIARVQERLEDTWVSRRY